MDLKERLNNFLNQPEANKWHVKQIGTSSFEVYRGNTKEYVVLSKTVVTRSKYCLIKNEKEIMTLEQSQLGNSYKILEGENELASLNFHESQVFLNYNNSQYVAKPEVRAKVFTFFENENVVFTIDKTKLSVSDKYRVVVSKEFNSEITFMVAIALDDFYHDGLKV